MSTLRKVLSQVNILGSDVGLVVVSMHVRSQLERLGGLQLDPLISTSFAPSSSLAQSALHCDQRAVCCALSSLCAFKEGWMCIFAER